MAEEKIDIYPSEAVPAEGGMAGPHLLVRGEIVG